MGTNFYWLARLPNGDTVDFDHEEHEAVRTSVWREKTSDSWTSEIHQDDSRLHIGKRSAAGRYCWDCRRTLCKGGESHIHLGGPYWYDACPGCSKAPLDPTLPGALSGAGAVELGFAKPENAVPTGVTTVASFTWAQTPEDVIRTCENNEDVEVVVDEYGRRLTGRAFLTMLKCNCPIEYRRLIGQRFS